MKSLKQYIVESEQQALSPAAGDNFSIEFDDGVLVETYILDATDSAILLDTTPEIIEVISEWSTIENISEDATPETLDVIMEMGYGSITHEAEYQGHNVPLGKPMRGDVKKFKVYVRDPKTGNVKKVNFGHGGTSAKRAGQKTMKIKKSNPARRRSFRARHHCENPGPRTKARYWSCRAW